MFANLGVVSYWTFLITTVGVVLLPGPNSLFVLATAAQTGIVKGYHAACGVFVGDTMLMTFSILGVSSLLKAFPMLFILVKSVGALYLFYLGIMMLKGADQKYKAPKVEIDYDTTAQTRLKNPFKKALLLSLSNPKSILFFVAFFIQFVDHTYTHTGLSFFILGLTVQICSFTYLTFLIFTGAALAIWFYKRQRLAATATAGVGLLFVGFGVSLAIASLD